MEDAVHPNSGAYLRRMSETNETGEIIHFARYEFADGYVGTKQWLSSLYSGKIPFDCGRLYSFIIDCRVTDIKKCLIAFEHYENAFVSKDTKEEAWPQPTFPLRPGREWQNVKTNLRFEPHFKENRGKLKVLDKWLRIQITGKTNLKLDFKNIYVQ